MSSTEQSENEQAARVLTKILDNEQQFVSEKRSDYRELLFVPAKVFQAEFDFEVGGFTRDVSTRGVCLIMPQPFRTGTEAQIDLFGQNTHASSLAKCCWSSKFGDAHWVSGWQLEAGIAIGRLLKEDRAIESEQEQRNSDRLQAAVPISIYLPDNTYRVPGFTRNLSHSGLCLVSKVEIQPNQVADLEVMCLTGESSRIESRCMWTKQYDDGHWVSGWKFSL